MAGDLSQACRNMYTACVIWSVGYDQLNRLDIWDGGTTDCSALVIWALEKAGFDVGGATYTGNMSDELCARGWARIPFSDLSQCRKGDILLNDARHVAMVIEGSGRSATLAQASIDENGRITGGIPGDQTGNETNVRQVYVYSHGWDCILRYEGSSDLAFLEVDSVLGSKSVSEWQRQCGTPVDGIVSGQLSTCRDSYPNLSSVTFEGGGSQLMEVVQRAVGVANPTGIIADVTVMRLQVWLKERGYALKGALAGVLDAPTAKAVQMSLNDGMWL